MIQRGTTKFADSLKALEWANTVGNFNSEMLVWHQGGGGAREGLAQAPTLLTDLGDNLLRHWCSLQYIENHWHQNIDDRAITAASEARGAFTTLGRADLAARCSTAIALRELEKLSGIALIREEGPSIHSALVDLDQLREPDEPWPCSRIAEQIELPAGTGPLDAASFKAGLMKALCFLLGGEVERAAATMGLLRQRRPRDFPEKWTARFLSIRISIQQGDFKHALNLFEGFFGLEAGSLDTISDENQDSLTGRVIQKMGASEIGSGYAEQALKNFKMIERPLRELAEGAKDEGGRQAAASMYLGVFLAAKNYVREDSYLLPFGHCMMFGMRQRLINVGFLAEDTDEMVKMLDSWSDIDLKSPFHSAIDGLSLQSTVGTLAVGYFNLAMACLHAERFEQGLKLAEAARNMFRTLTELPFAVWKLYKLAVALLPLGPSQQEPCTADLVLVQRRFEEWGLQKEVARVNNLLFG